MHISRLVAHKIITETHQGQLSCTSTVGVGTTFLIRIPVKLVQKAENIPPIPTLASAL